MPWPKPPLRKQRDRKDQSAFSPPQRMSQAAGERHRLAILLSQKSDRQRWHFFTKANPCSVLLRRLFAGRLSPLSPPSCSPSHGPIRPPRRPSLSPSRPL